MPFNPMYNLPDYEKVKRENDYLKAASDYHNQTGFTYKTIGEGEWTPEMLRKALKHANMSLRKHYDRFSKEEGFLNMLEESGFGHRPPSTSPGFIDSSFNLDTGYDPGKLSESNELDEIWGEISSYIGEDFNIDLDPEGKWKALEDVMIQDARQAYSPEREVGRAMADYSSQADMQQRQMVADMKRRGMSDAAIAQAMNRGLGTQAAQRAGLMDQARYSADERSRQVRNQALGYGLQSKGQEMERMLAEEGVRHNRLGLGLQGAQSMFDRTAAEQALRQKELSDQRDHMYNAGRLGLGWQDMDNKYKLGWGQLNAQQQLGRDKLDAQATSDLWAGGATLGVGALKNWDSIKDIGSTVSGWLP